MFNSLRSHGLQHTRLLCPALSPGVLLKLTSIESRRPPNHLIFCCCLLLLPSIFSSISFSITPSNEYSGLISFRIDWFDLLAVQETLKGLLQHHNSKVSVLLCSVFFMVQLSHPYVTTGKTIALTRQTLVGKVMSLLFDILSRFVTAFLPRSKRLLISRLQSMGSLRVGHD